MQDLCGVVWCSGVHHIAGWGATRVPVHPLREEVRAAGEPGEETQVQEVRQTRDTAGCLKTLDTRQFG